MAATEVQKPNGCIILTAIDADWTHEAEVVLYGYSFIPGTANTDVCVVKYDTDAGATIFKAFSATESGEYATFPKPIKCIPMVDFSDCTLNIGHQLTLFTGVRF